jgi:hypothetical protein
MASFTPRPLYPQGKAPRYPLDRRLSLRDGLDAEEKRKFLTLPGLELRPLGRPARSQSLYLLHYPYTSNIIWLWKYCRRQRKVVQAVNAPDFVFGKCPRSNLGGTSTNLTKGFFIISREIPGYHIKSHHTQYSFQFIIHCHPVIWS